MSQSSSSMAYSVWLVTRPLSYATLFPLSETTSDGKRYLRHWGVIVTELGLVDAKAIMLRTRAHGNENDMDLGVLYELFQDGDSRNNVNIVRPLRMATIREHWRMFSADYIGQTEMTHEMIEREGNRLTTSS